MQTTSLKVRSVGILNFVLSDAMHDRVKSKVRGVDERCKGHDK